MENWKTVRAQLLDGTYQPKPVREVEIPKSGGGVRKLGIPSVLDRFIQQSILQVLQPRFDPTFSEHSHGFRPGRRAHDAVCEAQQYIQGGRRVVVDVDLEKFFDRVNHDVLMGKLSARIEDKRVLGLIRRYLEAGIMANGVVVERVEGTPQGGPLSPLLANVLLDEVESRNCGATWLAGSSITGLRTRLASSRTSTHGSATGCGSSNSSSGGEERRSFGSCVPGESRRALPAAPPCSHATGGERLATSGSRPRCPRATSTVWESRGLLRNLNDSNRRMRTRTSGGVGGGE